MTDLLAEPDLKDAVMAVLQSDQRHAAKLLRIAALATGATKLPNGGDLERLARLAGISRRTAYEVLATEPKCECADDDAVPELPIPTALYRWFDAADVLLYVGVSKKLAGRTTSHDRKSAWMDFAVRSTIERHPRRSLALAAETAAIKDENPVFNIQGNDTPAARQRRADYLAAYG